jgi:hypothetical protein
MPNVVGAPLDSAMASLTSTGLPTPTIHEQISTSADDGQILSQIPAAGSLHPGVIALVVARTPVVTYLSDLSAIGDDPDSGARNVAGHTFSDSIYSTTSGCDRVHTFEYTLAKRYQQGEATVGLADSSKNRTGKLRFEVTLDDRPAFATTVSPGRAVPMHLNIRNVQRLTLRVTYVGPATRNCQEDTAVWGNARLLTIP